MFLVVEVTPHYYSTSAGTESDQSFDDTNNFVNAMSFNTSTGILTLTRNDGGTVTQDLDNRYITGYTETDTLASVTGRGASTGTAISITNSQYERTYFEAKSMRTKEALPFPLPSKVLSSFIINL